MDGVDADRVAVGLGVLRDDEAAAEVALALGAEALALELATGSDMSAEQCSKMLAKAAETVHGVSWFEVVEVRGAAADGKVVEYQVTLDAGFKVD